ncbi:MAG: FkbM family methyltransferase [Phyllobacterium sp.]|uniref:FkbM family methyltransferase n=1 Tax=Phyllobacterium sp. TaxID=1871046 RepID=UPI0030F1F060
MSFDKRVRFGSTSTFTSGRKIRWLSILSAAWAFAVNFSRNPRGKADESEGIADAAATLPPDSDVIRVCRILDSAGMLRRNAVVLQLGAGRGLTTIALATCGTFSTVIAVEPEPGNFRILTKRVTDNNVEHVVRTVPCAAGMIDGLATFYINGLDSLKSSIKQKNASDVPVRIAVNTAQTILDDARIAPYQLGLVWMDIEGYEAMACLGLLKALWLGIPILMVFSPDPAHPHHTAAFLRFLATHYHRCVVFEGETARTIALAEIPVDRVGLRILLIN